MQQRLKEAALLVDAGLEPPAGTDTVAADAVILNSMVETWRQQMQQQDKISAEAAAAILPIPLIDVPLVLLSEELRQRQQQQQQYEEDEEARAGEGGTQNGRMRGTRWKRWKCCACSAVGLRLSPVSLAVTATWLIINRVWLRCPSLACYGLLAILPSWYQQLA
jgi:hypothetical protein